MRPYSTSNGGKGPYSHTDLHLTVIVCILVFCVTRSVVGATVEVCDGETFEPTCSSGEELVIHTAKYGRPRLGRCISRDYGQLGCFKDVLGVLDAECSGKSTCQIVVFRGNEELSNDNQCDKELAQHMEIEYTCIEVQSAEPQRCRQEAGATVNGRQGIISSHVTAETGCGGLDTPWIIEASPGQRINVSLADFGWTTRGRDELQPPSQCDVYGYISERRLGMNNTLCGGLARERHVYYSASNSLQIQIASSRSVGYKPFLIEYKVVGCPDVKSPDHAWYKREGNTAVIGCEWSEHSWHLTCEGNAWVGVVGNCSGGEVKQNNDDIEHFEMPPVLTIGLIVGLGVLVVVLLCVLIIGCICCRRHANRHDEVEKNTLDSNYEGQAFLYYPGRPVPIQGATHVPTMQPHMHPQAKQASADELLHIWETPLPMPAGDQQNDSGIVSEPTYASLPSRGTMAGPCPSHDSEPRVAAGEGVMAGDVTWPGTRAFFDPGTGWVTSPSQQ